MKPDLTHGDDMDQRTDFTRAKNGTDQPQQNLARMDNTMTGEQASPHGKPGDASPESRRAKRRRDGAELIRGTDRRDGFTMIEIVVVLLLLGTLASVAVPKTFHLVEDAELKSAMAAVEEAQARLTASFGDGLLRGYGCEQARARVNTLAKISDGATIQDDGSISDGNGRFGEIYLGFAGNAAGGILSGESIPMYGGRHADSMQKTGLSLYPPVCGGGGSVAAASKAGGSRQNAVSNFLNDMVAKVLNLEAFTGLSPSAGELAAMGLQSVSASSQNYAGNDPKTQIALTTLNGDRVELTMSDRRTSGNRISPEYYGVTVAKVKISPASGSPFYVVGATDDVQNGASRTSENLATAKSIMQSAGLDVENDFPNVFSSSYSAGEIPYLPLNR